MNRFQLTAFLSVFLFLTGCAVEKTQEASAAKSHTGEAIDFSLKNTDGESVSLKDQLAKNKAVLLNFWATWCPPCREEIPDLIRLQEKYKNKSFTILGVDIGESAGKVKSFAKKAGMNYPIVIDTNQSVSESYGVVGIPTSYLVSSDGKILGEYHAATPELFADVENATK